MAKQLNVKTPEGQYPIVIETGALAHIERHVTDFGLDGHVVIATDDTVQSLYADALRTKLPNAQVVSMPSGEQHKHLETVRHFYDELIRLKADRHTTLVALGGGVVGDTVGFVAASYMRGIRFVQMPTTLLAMVDSSVGGKVGVDLPQGKNLVGAFKQPALVLIDTDVLQTLPPSQWRAGMAEVIKHGFIADSSLLNPTQYSPDNTPDMVARAVQVKIDIVEQDPYEENIRAFLNLGHTFAHAIEQVTHYAWLHGDAVGVGLLLAGKLSVQLGITNNTDLVPMIDNLLQKIGLPRSIGNLDPETLYSAMATDKKWKGGKSRFVLLEDVGKPVIVTDAPKELVLAALTETS